MFAGAAAADPVADKQAQARVLAQQIDSLGGRESALSEQYDKSALEVQAAQAKIVSSAALFAKADADASRARSALRADAVDSYVHSRTLASRVSGAVDPQATVLRAEYAQTLASAQSEHLDQFRAAAAQAKQAGATLESARQQAAAKTAQLDAARIATLASERQLQATLAQVHGEIATQLAAIASAKQAEGIRQAQLLVARRQQMAVAAVAAPPVGPPASPTGPPTVAALAASTARLLPSPAALAALTPARPPVPTGSGGGAAVAAAKTRLGLPYVWGASGPDSFDCSGLTMWAWAHAGVSLPHFSGAQYASTAHISMADLQPGDLVFESDPGAHVAMYIGGGQIIAAPHSGTVVQIQPLWSGYVLASRP
jgi:cell wall-associated NlpC family hydrolase